AWASSLSRFSTHVDSTRDYLKKIWTKEKKLDDLRRRRKSASAEAEAAEKQLSKMSWKYKISTAQIDSLNGLRAEIRSMDSEIMAEEAALRDLKQTITRFWMGSKFSALLECSEKGKIAADFAGKTINLRLRAQDGTSLGAWFVLSEPAYRSLPSPLEPKRTIDDDAANTTDTAEALIRHALSTSPTLLFLHGNSGTRALPRRIALYTALTARVSANVFALDYRGFGDSAGRPSVAGVAMDARAAWDWLTRVHGARPRDVLVVGHSLGTAVAGMLAAQLGREGVDVRGVVLFAPFSSVKLLMQHYAILGVPFLKPLAKLPFVPGTSLFLTDPEYEIPKLTQSPHTDLLADSIAHNFDTLSQVPDIVAPVFIAHALDDFDIPHEHADILFDALVEARLPPTAASNSTLGAYHAGSDSKLDSDAGMDTYTDTDTPPAVHRARLVQRTEVPHFGVLHEFVAPAGTGGRRVVLLKTRYGGHDVGWVEGVQDVLRGVFGFV
ncbi:hypothetical protein C0993_005329, partial [Termitomyces sp. T159_Od127]